MMGINIFLGVLKAPILIEKNLKIRGLLKMKGRLYLVKILRF